MANVRNLIILALVCCHNPTWREFNSARLLRWAAATIPDALKLLPALFLVQDVAHIDAGYRPRVGFNVPSDGLIVDAMRALQPAVVL